MRTLRRAGLPALAACLVVLSAARADDKPDAKPDAKSDTKAVDAAVRKGLFDVIEHGRAFFNKGDVSTCVVIYDTGLLTVKPMLAHHPKVQSYIEDGRDFARRAPNLEDAAFRLREVLDDVREALKPGGELPEKKKSLWDRLGGDKGVAKIVDDWIELDTKNPKVNLTRDGKYLKDATSIARLKRGLIDLFSSGFGGPHKYEGSLKVVHKGMGITDEEFDASVADLEKALKKNGVAEADMKYILEAVEGTRRGIVEKGAATKSLWERLGGDKGVEKIMDDFIESARKDKDVNFDRNGKYKLDDEALAKVKKELVRQFSNIVGGPYKVDKSEKPPYKGLGITDAEFDAATKHFRKALEKNGVKEDLTLVMVAVAGQRDAVVEKAPEPGKGTLWERLGGEKGATKVAESYYARATAKDSKANLDRGGALKLSDPEVADKVKKQLLAQVTIAAGGPGADELKPFAKDEKLTDAEFDARKQALGLALIAQGLSTDDVRAVAAAFEKWRKDVVETKKPDDKPGGSTVEGKITADGKPVSGGKISFVGTDDKPISGQIGKDGTYKVSGLKMASYRIVIEVPEKVNQIYATAETTPLKLRCTGDEQGADYDLKK
jgi:hemoglobin